MKIALITYLDKGNYDSTTVEGEDNQLLNFLQSKGLQIELVIWNDKNIIWDDYQLAILKSPWDYFDLIDDFNEWLNLLEEKKIKLLNPLEVVKWNSDKHYLKDIQSKGLNIVPSNFISKNENIQLDTFFKKFSADNFIVKPTVSGGAKNTFKVNSYNVEEVNAKISVLLKKEDFIVQPFLNEIVENGEWSFIFFGGKFSHALLKKAKSGDFRVQHAFGGTIYPQNPDSELLDEVQKYVNQFAKECLYARVDGVIINNQFHLMELELIEPFLFLNTDPQNYERYYKSLLELIS